MKRAEKSKCFSARYCLQRLYKPGSVAGSSNLAVTQLTVCHLSTLHVTMQLKRSTLCLGRATLRRQFT